MRNLAILFAALSLTLFAGCRTVAVIPVGTHTTVTHSQQIYPPYAPEHGYRHHHHDHDLEYDSNYGAYLVLGYDDLFFYNNLYMRYFSGQWQITSRLDGRWRPAEHNHVPDRLRGHKRYQRHNRHSPPPYAPAHGHRHHHRDGVDLVFDSGIGAYVVLGFDDLFFFNNNFMRFYDGYWHYSDRHNAKWNRAHDYHVPQKLRRASNRNKTFFKKIKKQYRKEHQESREYRKKHDNRGDRHDGRNDRRNSKDDRNDGRSNKGDRDGRYDRKDRRTGTKLKKEQRQQKDREDQDERDDRDDRDGNDRREKRSNGSLR